METKPKSRFSRVMMAALAGSVALGGMGATLAYAGNHDASAKVQALSTAKVTLADAIRTAEAAGQGIVTGAEFDATKDGTYFDVTTQNGTTEIDHRIDPMTGAILASTPNVEKDDGDSNADEAQELAAIQGAKVSLLQAISTAEGQGAKVMGIEYETEDGTLGIELQTADTSGAVSESMVNAATGAAIQGDQDSADDKGDEAGEQQEADEGNEAGEQQEAGEENEG
ncbi:PepSY domain-containing protein [Paracoccus subflavus]|nr:PepSY domain-containing protein [Paracoccus subflavus]